MRILATKLLMLCLAPCFLYAQNTGKISGKIVDHANKQVLEGATISALNESTGIFIRHAVSSKKGEFTITGLPLNTKIEVIVSFTGYRDSSMVVLIKDKTVLNIGEWKLDQAGNELEEVTVTARKPPFVVKKDTLEFNASAFKSLPNDMVQDLLRKLPGMVIDESGNVSVNGKKVNKIKVDGRDFFGSNIKVATENLPGAIIDKVQVYETRERGEQFNSVIEPAAKDLTLNLTLKKENKKGIFGHVSAGYGTEDRYNGGAFINSFNQGKRLSLFGDVGNIDGVRGFGGMQMAAVPLGIGLQGGITKNNSSAGLNFNNDLGKKGKVEVNYIMTDNKRESITGVERTNILPDSVFLYNNQSKSNNVNRSHNIRSNFEVEIDTLQSFTISPTIGFNQDNTDAFNNAASTTTKGENINTQQNRNRDKNESFWLDNRFIYNRSSADRKTNFTINWNITMRHGSGDQYNLSKNVFYYNNLISRDSLDQSGNTKNNSISNNVAININRRISKKFIGILHYAFMQNGDNYDKDVFNFNNTSGAHDLIDSTYSIHNKNTGITHLATGSIGYRGEKFSAEIGAGMRFINQDNKIIWKDSTITVQQQNFTPRSSISYRINRNSQFIAHYSVDANQPTSEQLAPVQDNTNPLYIKVGNPFLKSSITHQFNSELRYFTADYKWRAAIMGSGLITSNQIVQDSYYDSTGRQYSTFQNVDGAKQFNVNINFGSSIRFSDWNFMFDLSSGINSSTSIGFVNRKQNNSRTVQFNPQVMFGVNYKSKFFLHSMSGIDINSTKYSLDGINDIDYNVKRLMVMSRWAPIQRLGINASVVYLYNSQLPEDFQRSKTLLNSSVSYNFLRNERLSVSVSINDILNNNINVSRSVMPNAIETTQVNALRRYAMLTVNYRLSNFNRGMMMF